ncbi:hypothetical protein STAFG_4788 [Streptomyces afghaniensis 772]|uniref:Uncharacterized protein n=1 Tax=Streptomyces afghaniensis 772 TaxID=1283301 RepID=S4MN90_9ACTN|nr:hypothetical protein STAFG_4788 [Streptomyces afghaniensis 772]
MRPLIAIPARFSARTSALRYAAEVNARSLIEAVWRAGGEPVGIHPADTGTAARLARFDGVLLPGGGDLAPPATAPPTPTTPSTTSTPSRTPSTSTSPGTPWSRACPCSRSAAASRP